MASEDGKSSGGPNITIIVVVALLLVGGIAFWAMTRHQSAEKTAGATISGSATVGDKSSDVNLKVDLPDTVTIGAH